MEQQPKNRISSMLSIDITLYTKSTVAVKLKYAIRMYNAEMLIDTCIRRDL